MSKKKRLCPLDDPNIGIIPENDHRVGLCLCRFCDCGMHKCAKNANPTLKSALSSKYMVDYKRSQFDVPLKPHQKAYRKNTAKMDLVTTNQIEFRKRKPTPEVSKASPSPYFKSDIFKQTVYSVDYPNWGAWQVSREKRWHPPVRSVDLSFVGNSSYKEKFQSHDTSQVDLYKTDITTLSAFNSKFSLAPKEKLSANTTYTETMKDYTKEKLNSRIIVRPKASTPTPVTVNHFTTTFQDSFKVSMPGYKDPRQVRQSLSQKRRSGSGIK